MADKAMRRTAGRLKRRTATPGVSTKVKSRLSARFGYLLDQAIEAAPKSVRQVADKERDVGRALSLVLTHANPTVPAGPLAAAQARAFAMKERMLIAAGGTLSVNEAASHMGVTRQAVHKALRSGRLISHEGKGGVRLLPAFQFSDNIILHGLPEVLATLPLTGFWTRLSFFLARTPELDGRTPVEALQAGESAVVVRAAKSYGEQQAA